MNKLTIFFFIIVFQSFSFGQNPGLCYEPIKRDMKNDKWDDIDLHLDSMYLKYSDSIIVPFTLHRIGRKLFQIQDFDRLFKYSKLMLEYDYSKLKTKFPESSKTKWESYCKDLPTRQIYNWGHFFLASACLERQQYDSCLIHLDSSSIENYTSLPRQYKYNLCAGLHLTMMKSICLEGKGKIDEAREILIPYLFLDKFQDIKNFFDHTDIVTQYFKLKKQSATNSQSIFSPPHFFSINKILEEKVKRKDGKFPPPQEYTESNDSIVTASGWYYYQRDPVGSYIRVEDNYVRIYIDQSYYSGLGENKTFSLTEYINQTEFYRQYRQR